MDTTKPVLKSWLQSSTDSSKISLSIESGGKALAGVIAVLAAVKGLDPAAATAMWQSLVDQAVILVTAGFTAFHAVQAISGLVRKVIVYVGSHN